MSPRTSSPTSFDLVALICGAGAEDLAVEAALLDWLGDHPQIGRTDIWLRHCRGLVGQLTGTVRLMNDLLPEADWRLRIESCRAGAARRYRASVVPVFERRPFCAVSGDGANALLAATLTAFAAGGSVIRTRATA